MKMLLCPNRKLYQIELLKQNKYLGHKIDSVKPVIKTFCQNFNNRNILLKSSSKKEGIKIL